jgi:nucleoside-diphosphate-sugar epimerase
MKVLLSGNKGFIGTQIWNALAGTDYSYSGFDQGMPIPDERFDYILHFGARTLIRKSRELPYQYFLDNTDLTLRILEKARRDNSRIVFPTSGSVLEATNPYSLSKRNGEEWITLYSKMYGVQSYILKLFNIYGETSRKGAVYLFTKAALEDGRVTIFGNGTHVRDFTHVDDLIRFVMVILSGKISPGSYEVGTGVGTSVLDLLKIVEEVTGTRLSVKNEDYVVPEAEELHAKSSILPNMVQIKDGVHRVYRALKQKSV